MEQLGPLIADYQKFSAELQEKIFAWVDPTGSMAAAPTRSWPLADLGSAMAIVAGYLAFVVLGQLIMALLPPIRLYGLRFIYNLAQIALCSYMAIEAGILAYRNGYTLKPCNPYNALSPPVGNLLWLFYVSKIFDFFDTFFIILGKKSNQLSFLHIYHHATIFSFYWLNLNAGYDGDVYLTIVLNGVIHTIMYTYYFVCLHTDNIWWKKYLTLCQLIQFICMMSQATYMLLSGCPTYPHNITKGYLFYILSLFVLFVQFYISSYVGKGKKSKKA